MLSPSTFDAELHRDLSNVKIASGRWTGANIVIKYLCERVLRALETTWRKKNHAVPHYAAASRCLPRPRHP